MLAKVLMLVVFFAVMIVVGILARRGVKNANDFVLGGRNVGPWLTAFSYGTSYFSAVVFVGYAGQFGWKFGLSSTWIGLGNAFIGSLLAWVIMGRRTRVMTHHISASTMPEFFGKRYDSSALKIIASVITFVFMIPYTASVFNGLSGLFGLAFDIDYKVCVIAMAALTGVYVILGGYLATAWNDLIQGIIMLIGICAVVVAVLNGNGGFYSAVKSLSEIPSDAPATLGQQGAFASFFGTDPVGLLSVIVLTSLGTWGLPQMIGKFYAIKNEKCIKTGTVISTAFALVVAGGSYFLGGFGRLYADNPAIYKADGSVKFDNIVPTMLSNVPDILAGVVVVLVLSASMSTLSSLVLTSSSTITLDIFRGHIVKNMKDKTQLLWMRILIVFFIVVSVAIALDPPDFIAQLMGISWGALAGAFLAPFLYGLYWKRVNKWSVVACFITGVGLTVTNMIWGYLGNSIVAGAVAMVAGLVVVPIVTWLTPKPDRAFVENIFECYEKKTVVAEKLYLQDLEDAK